MQQVPVQTDILASGGTDPTRQLQNQPLCQSLELEFLEGKELFFFPLPEAVHNNNLAKRKGKSKARLRLQLHRPPGFAVPRSMGP